MAEQTNEINTVQISTKYEGNENTGLNIEEERCEREKRGSSSVGGFVYLFVSSAAV
jgi:hypothetical protein